MVCVNGESLWEFAKSPNESVKFTSQDERFAFARMAIAHLSSKCPETQSKGLVRVDIMQNDSGEMIVNEFESLEAIHYEKSGQDKPKAKLVNFLNDYYFDMLLSFSTEIINERM